MNLFSGQQWKHRHREHRDCLWMQDKEGEGGMNEESSMETCILLYINQIIVQSLSCVHLFETTWTVACQASLSFISWSLLKLTSIESAMPSNYLVLCPPFLLPPSISPSIRDFSNELTLHIRWLKYWSFCFSISKLDSKWEFAI